MDSTVTDDPPDELDELCVLTHQLKSQLVRHRGLGAWFVPGGPTARPIVTAGIPRLIGRFESVLLMPYDGVRPKAFTAAVVIWTIGAFIASIVRCGAAFGASSSSALRERSLGAARPTGGLASATRSGRTRGTPATS